MSLGEVVETDVLVVGWGGAASWAAIKAATCGVWHGRVQRGLG
jgi:succinate dehydrogenase/fumarate reductase flavoprotein subunit